MHKGVWDIRVVVSRQLQPGQSGEWGILLLRDGLKWAVNGTRVGGLRTLKVRPLLAL